MSRNGEGLCFDINDLVEQVEGAYGSPIPELDRLRQSSFRQWGNVPLGNVMRALNLALKLVKGRAYRIKRDEWPEDRDGLIQLIIDLARRATPAEPDPGEHEAVIAYILGAVIAYLKDRDADGFVPFAAYRSMLLCNRVHDRMDPEHPPQLDEIEAIAALGAKYGAEAGAAKPQDWNAWIPSTPLQVRLAAKMEPGVTDEEWQSLIQRLLHQSANDRRFVRTDDEVNAELTTLRQETAERVQLEQDLLEPLRSILTRLGLPESSTLSVKVCGKLVKPTGEGYVVELASNRCNHGCMRLAVLAASQEGEHERPTNPLEALFGHHEA